MGMVLLLVKGVNVKKLDNNLSVVSSSASVFSLCFPKPTRATVIVIYTLTKKLKEKNEEMKV